jgi:hypothetical protein
MNLQASRPDQCGLRARTQSLRAVFCAQSQPVMQSTSPSCDLPVANATTQPDMLSYLERSFQCFANKIAHLIAPGVVTTHTRVPDDLRPLMPQSYTWLVRIRMHTKSSYLYQNMNVVMRCACACICETENLKSYVCKHM